MLCRQNRVLSAVQNDYELYSTFNTALSDITETVVLGQTYDKIYQDRIPYHGRLWQHLPRIL